MKKAPWDYEVAWYFRGEDHNDPEVTKVSATSVPRAISKVKKDVQAEMGDEFVASDFIVIDVKNVHYAKES